MQTAASPILLLFSLSLLSRESELLLDVPYCITELIRDCESGENESLSLSRGAAVRSKPRRISHNTQTSDAVSLERISNQTSKETTWIIQ